MNASTAWILRIVPAAMMATTLPFKFTGAQESKDLFSTLTEKALGNPDLESMARLGTGAVELIAIILLLVPKWSSKGALLTVATMAGALVSHVLFLGFGGHSQLVTMAVIALITSAIFLVLSRSTTK